MSNTLFPIFVKTDTPKFLIIGGGAVGLEKANALLNQNKLTHIRLIAKEVSQDVKDLPQHFEHVIIEQKTFEEQDLNYGDLIIVATNDVQLNAHVKQLANAQNKLVNVADQPNLCDFYLSSIVTKGDLKIAISTNGKSPTIAKRLKEVLNENLPNEIDQTLENFATIRQHLKGDFKSKVIQLNNLSEGLVTNNTSSNTKKSINWQKIAYRCLLVFLIMIVGHILLNLLNFNDILTSGKNLIGTLDKSFYFMILAGFLAQLVDGILGMGYGVTCTAVLLGMGVPLPAISGSIHTAEMFSSGASGFSHYKFGNVNKRLFKYLVIPGVVGSVIGAILLSKLGDKYSDYIKPIIALYTMFLGLRILYNAFKKANNKQKKVKKVGWLAVAGGFLDSFGGGGWGPLVTSTLISKGKTPRFVIGSVSLAEFFVTFASALAFFGMIGLSHWQVIAGLIIGGVTAAPIAARLAGKLPVKAMFIGIGSLVVLWSLLILIKVISKM